jgi:hypothetical protein
MSHFVSRKLYYSGKEPLEFATLTDTGFNPSELKARLLCSACEARFSRNGEDEVLKHVAPKLVLKRMPLAERMRAAGARDSDPSVPSHDARDFDIDTDKFAYFALSIVWRRTIHEWSSAISRWELGRFGEDMRTYLLGETVFPHKVAVIVIVCSDQTSRRMWTVPMSFDEAGCRNFAFQARGIYFRVMEGFLPLFAIAGDCRGPRRPVFFANCERMAQQRWDNTIAAQLAQKDAEQ